MVGPRPDHGALRSPLQHKREFLVERWAHTAVAANIAVAGIDLRRYAETLMDQVVTAILTEPLDLQQAQLIGILLASLHPLQPPILVVTQQVVLEHGLADLDPAVDAALRPRVIAALGAITTGFLLQMQMRLQSDLEPVRQALLSHSQRLERQLYDLDQQFTLILANAPVILWATDRDGYFELAQGLGLTRFGLTPEDVIGQPVHVVEARAPQLRPLLQRALRGEMFTSTVQMDEGSFVCRYTPRYNAIGEVQGVLALAVDMTEQTQTMQALHATRHTLLAQFEASQRALARELHDRVIQPLLGFTYQLTTLQQQLDVTETPDTVHTPTLTAFRGLHTSTIEIITTIRTLISELRIPGAEELNVVLAIEEFVSYLDGVASEPHPIIALELPEQEIRLPPSIAQCLFRVAQEGIRNALRHAQASSINVTLRMIETQIMLQIRDDGQGFVAPHPLNRLVQTNSFGLVGIAERVADVGGVFTITSAPGQGATLQIQIDVPESERAYGDSHSYSPGG